MKNAGKHTDDLKSLIRRLLRESKADPRKPLEPLEALVRGAMSYDVADGKADEAMKAINEEFVDLNELRVATDLEIQELLGVRYPEIERRVAMITQALNDIFEKEHTLSLDRLKTISKRDARQFLRELPEIHPFVEAYVMLFSLEGHAFPLDEAMMSMLRQEGAVSEKTTHEEAQKFVEHHLKSEELYEFYVAMRRAALDDDDGKGRKKSKS